MISDVSELAPSYNEIPFFVFRAAPPDSASSAMYVDACHANSRSGSLCGDLYSLFEPNTILFESRDGGFSWEHIVTSPEDEAWVFVGYAGDQLVFKVEHGGYVLQPSGQVLGELPTEFRGTTEPLGLIYGKPNVDHWPWVGRVPTYVNPGTGEKRIIMVPPDLIPPDESGDWPYEGGYRGGRFRFIALLPLSAN